MSSDKIHKLKSIFTANGGCGCRPKPADVIQPQTKPKSTLSDQRFALLPSSSGAVEEDDCSSTIFSLFTADASPHRRSRGDHAKTVGPCRKIHDSLAVVKDSDDPYRDFRQSMLQMILEKEIYSRNDLQQLLDCFLKLNSPRHHEVIVRAFMEIWNGGGRRRRGPSPVSHELDKCGHVGVGGAAM